MVLAVAAVGLVAAAAIALTPWHPHAPGTSAVVEVYAPSR